MPVVGGRRGTRGKAAVVALAFGASLIITPPSRGEAPPSTYGHGLTSCRAFVSAWQIMDNRLIRSYLTWLDGYLSARGAGLPYDIKGGARTDSYLPWLADYCLDRPREDFAVAVDALARWLLSGREKPE